MNILIFSQYYYPEKILINEIAEELVAKGNEVTVITGKPCYNFPYGKIPSEYRKTKCEVINGVNVIRCNVFSRGENIFSILLYYFSYMISAWLKSRRLKSKYDVVYLYQLTPIFQAFPAIKYCQQNNLKLFCYCLDIAPECGMSISGKSKITKDLYCRFSKWAYNACSLIGVTSKSFIEYQQIVNNVPREKLVYLPQHASSLLLEHNLQNRSFDPNKIVFLFAGNVGLGAKIDTILFAAKELVEKGENRFYIRILGDGSAKDDLIRLSNRLDLNNVVGFEDGVPMSSMPEEYKKADVLLISLRKGQITVPGKLQAYMATGKPIIGAINGSANEIIKEAMCGAVCEAENSVALAALLNDVVSSPNKYFKMGENGKKYFVSNFTLDKHILNLFTYLERLIGLGIH